MSECTIIAFAIEPSSVTDRGRLDSALRQLMSEDRTLHVHADRETGQAIVAGTSERQLKLVAARVTGELNIRAAIGALRVIYKEILTRPAEGEATFVRHSGGQGQYAHVKIRLVPGAPSTGYVFADRTDHGSIPKDFIGPIQMGIGEALLRRSRSNHAIVNTTDVNVGLYDGSYHDVDSSQMAFKIAGALAFEDAIAKASPVLQEPIMRLEVVVPSAGVADVLHDLSKRRAKIESLEPRSETSVIRARVPLSTIIGYEAEYSIEFDRYEPCNVPPEIDDDRTSGVRFPRRPAPRPGDSAIALPEPDDDDD
jgi:elongation factor G